MNNIGRKFFICLYLVLPLKPNIALINFATHRHRFKVVKNDFSYYCFSFLNIFLGTKHNINPKLQRKLHMGINFKVCLVSKNGMGAI